MHKNAVGMIKVWSRAVLLCLGVLCYPAIGRGATDYHVGPGLPYTTIGSVPWYSLQAGDTVYIHYRTSGQGGAYHEKFLLSGRGTPTQWIRVLGVPGPNGELPVISGDNATTSPTMHYRWQTPDLIQWNGVIQIAVRADDASGSPPLPGYIEIANLQVQDGYASYQFTAENGTTLNYEGFAACIYARSVQHLLIRNNVLTNCGQGFYNWTGDGASGSTTWWDGIQSDTILRGNYFYNNGHVNSYTEHQAYSESDGVIYEYNRFGPQRPGALGSQLKDRSVGTVIRYNYIEQSLAGWDIDLVEPQESYSFVHTKPTSKQAFVYGNLIVSDTLIQNMVHWNEDHYGNVGRATLTGGTLFFYDNTVVAIADATGWEPQHVLFNVTYGGYECPPAALPGVIDVRNNIFVALPRTPGAAVPPMRFGYCGQENFTFGANWVTPGYTVHGAVVTGAVNLVAPVTNNPGFVNTAGKDFHLVVGASARGLGGALAPEVTQNSLGVDLTPTQQYVYHQQGTGRVSSGVGSDVGALTSGSGGAPLSPPINLRIQSTSDTAAAPVILAWDASVSMVDGYWLYYGTQSGTYTVRIDAGTAPTSALSGLTSGATYYFAVTAYDRTDSRESAFSNEVSTGLTPNQLPLEDGGQPPSNGQPPGGGRTQGEAQTSSGVQGSSGGGGGCTISPGAGFDPLVMEIAILWLASLIWKRAKRNSRSKGLDGGISSA